MDQISQAYTDYWTQVFAVTGLAVAAFCGIVLWVLIKAAGKVTRSLEDIADKLRNF